MIQCLSTRQSMQSNECFRSRCRVSPSHLYFFACEFLDPIANLSSSFLLNCFDVVEVRRTLPLAQNHHASRQYGGYASRPDLAWALDCYCHHYCATMLTTLWLIWVWSGKPVRTELIVEHRSHVAFLEATALDKFLDSLGEKISNKLCQFSNNWRKN